jgi:uncharacterized membrane protein
MENKVVRRTVAYLVSRDVLLFILVFSHTVISTNILTAVHPVIPAVLVICAVLWILFFTRLMGLVIKLRKDEYINSAFKDEYFSNAKLKAGFNAYTSMIIAGVLLAIASLILEAASSGIMIPVYIACEIIILSGVIADDITKLLSVRG